MDSGFRRNDDLFPGVMNSAIHRIELNGGLAQVEDLRYLVQTNYGHFSAMRVENGGVRGLDLHLDRLDQATRELFGIALDRGRVRDYLRHAIDGDARPLSLRVNVFSRALNRERMTVPAQPDVLVTTAAAAPPPLTPLRVKSFRYARDLPQIKHVGTFPLFHYRRLAQQAGFDDALFADDAGRISEGSIWNIGFHDGNGIVWPQAAQLGGVSMQLLQTGLARSGVASTTRLVYLRDIATLRGAFFTNASIPVRTITRIDETEFAVDEALMATVQQCYESNPWQRV
jgi:branched-subunit amino acid aminotransferase/4-amino-4-deoxychorismate lyase